MSFTLYNDLTRSKERFVPIREGHVSFYSCGPTVYDYFHVGNARPFIVFDVLRRYLEHIGYEVTFVQNFTDIDDKMINRANDEGITVGELSERFIAEYYRDADALGIRRPTVAPKATDHMAEIIDIVSKIMEKGHAYEVETAGGGKDVYFDVRSYAPYGRLSKQSLDELEAGARVEVEEAKRNPLDFALWKAGKPGEPSWESPWGKGRPGWHIECSAMASKYLGDTIDIHSGGVDLTFPHHENEVAQSEAAAGKPFVNFWLHNGFLLIDKEKMSKSLGNFMTARAAREAYPPLAIRLFMLSAHYRTQINFAPDGLEQAAGGVTRLRNCWADLMYAKETTCAGDAGISPFLKELDALDKRFYEAMDDDFNTAAAVGVLFELVKLVNTWLKDSRDGKITLPASFFDAAEKELRKLDDILGVIGIEDSTDEDVGEIDRMIEERNVARKAKNFSRSDEIRDLLLARGIVLEDTPQGTKWKRKIY
ncbi:MAG: cysteine--tRNA ligase [Oscillospiraceae bacterium]|nr:cysteine--tRNA ligase [Oscillospiraceae bacterium]